MDIAVGCSSLQIEGRDQCYQNHLADSRKRTIKDYSYVSFVDTQHQTIFYLCFPFL